MRGAFCPARGFERLLHIHAVIDDIGNELRMGERLIGSAHNAKPDMRIAALHESRNDGVKRPFAARKYVWMVWLECETEAAILKNEAHSVNRHPGAERRRYALNPAHHVAGAIDDREIRCVSVH